MSKSNKNTDVFKASAVQMNHNVSVRSTITDLEDNIDTVKKDITAVKNENANVKESINELKEDVKDIDITTKCEFKLTNKKQSYLFDRIYSSVKVLIVLEVIDVVVSFLDLII